MMSTNTAKKKGLGADSDDSNSVSSRPEDDRKQPHVRRSDTSSTSNEPASASATVTVSTAAARQPTSQSGLPTFAAAAAAAAPRVPMKEKKPRRAGFRDEFVPMLRIMLDRESQKDNTTVKWSTDGNSFIITDHTQFEHIVPTYFDIHIAFASFLRKLYRWGFKRVASRRAGHYKFCSPTFKRLDTDSAPPAASAVNTSRGGSGGGAPIQAQHQPAQIISTLLQQVMAQTNQQPAHIPLPTSQADTNAIIALISNLISSMQRQLSSQQPSIPSQPPVLNQSTNNPLNNNHILPLFQQTQHPNPTMSLLNTVLSIFTGGRTPSSAHLLGHSTTSSQSNALHALMSLHGLLLPQRTLPNTNNSEAMSQLLLLAMHRMGEIERERRTQADAINHAIISAIGLFVGGNSMTDEAGSLGGLVAGLAQTLGSTGETNASNVPLGTNTIVDAPNHNSVAHFQQVDAPPPPPAGNENIEAGSIAAILQAARRDDAAGQLGDVRAQNNNQGRGNHNYGYDGDGVADGPVSSRKRKSPDEDQYEGDDDNSRADDDSWNKRLRGISRLANK